MWDYFGASVTGPGHHKEGQGNQDFWGGGHRRFGTLLFVCDGMGSRVNSAFGSSQAVAATFDAVGRWSAAGCEHPEKLLRLIHLLWGIRVDRLGGDSCATTCLFAVAFDDGRLFLAQLGDGMIVALKTDGTCEVLETIEQAFSNQTHALGTVKTLEHWRWRMVSDAGEIRCVVLASDGVSEDLKEETSVNLCSLLVLSMGR